MSSSFRAWHWHLGMILEGVEKITSPGTLTGEVTSSSIELWLSSYAL